MGDDGGAVLGHPHLHLKRTDSTNERARELAITGAPHGTLVSAAEQTAGRGRQGRSWVAPPESALLCSLVLRNPPALLSLIAAVAVCDVVDEHLIAGHTQRTHGKRARVKWPNDIVMAPAARVSQPPATPTTGPGSEPHPTDQPNMPPFAKLAGILVEGRPQEDWAVLGIGLNVALRVEELPEQLRERAASLELPASAIESTMGRLMKALERRMAEPTKGVLDAWRGRDALLGRHVSWNQREGTAQGIDDTGRLIVRHADDSTTKLDAGEVHLGPA